MIKFARRVVVGFVCLYMYWIALVSVPAAFGVQL